jgi:hypothetical protein
MGEGWIDRTFVVLGRALGWGLLGAVCGLLLGFTACVAHAPPDIPELA